MLEVIDIYKDYENHPLLRGVSFSVSEGETVCLLGASGSGKSTLLRIIAGLEQPEAGSVRWNGVDLSGVPVHRRNFGLMFQDYALFPHRSVAENVAFGLRMKGLPSREIAARVAQALEQVHMAAFARRRVTDLSGGEQQRVALARAIAPQPRLLMLDEPLGALDRTLKDQLAAELRRLLRETGIPAIYVTHDQEEAFAVADRLVLLHQGRVEQTGRPQEVYDAPATPWVARFFGLNNLLPGALLSTHPLKAETELGVFEGFWRGSELPASPGSPSPVVLLFRPRGVTLSGDRENHLRGVVEDSVFQGEGFRVSLNVQGHAFSFLLDHPIQPGEIIDLSAPPQSVEFLEGGLDGGE